jgi:hypothetical protein
MKLEEAFKLNPSSTGEIYEEGGRYDCPIKYKVTIV